MFQDKTSQEFQCEYCPRTFSKRSSLRNHLRTHRDQMYLNETGLNTSIGPSDRPFISNEQDLMLEDNYCQVKEIELAIKLLNELPKIINKHNDKLFLYSMKMIYMEIMMKIIVKSLVKSQVKLQAKIQIKVQIKLQVKILMKF